MGLYDRDYMRDQPDPEPGSPRPRWGVTVVAIIVIAGILLAAIL